jgi:hypothetical protein
MSYRTIYHRDGSVTVWDCSAQSYTRTATPSARILATLSPSERDRVSRHTARSRRPDDETAHYRRG